MQAVLGGKAGRRASACAAAITAAALAGAFAGPASAASVAPQLYAGNPTCADVNPAWTEIDKVDPPQQGSHGWSGTTISGTYQATGALFDWTSSTPIDGVIVKGGPNANVYVYSPAASGDTGLSAPDNGGQPYGLSHISFCDGPDAPPPPGTPDTPQTPATPSTPQVVSTPQTTATQPQQAAATAGTIEVKGVTAARGTASLKAPKSCVSRTFTVTVNGSPVRRVSFYVDGQLVRRVSGKTGQRVFKATLPANRRGATRVTAKVTFTNGAQAKTLRGSAFRCRPAVLTPRFTG